MGLTGCWYRLLLALVLAQVPILAQYHQSGGDLKCSDCHTLHYSEEGHKPSGSESGGPFKGLLKASTINKLCLLCHDGTDVTAPAVLTPASMYTGSGDEHSAAGYFQNSGGVPSDKCHSLGVSTVPPDSTGLPAMTLTCTSCHDPHGSPNYRNLLTAPAGGGGTTLLLGTNVFQGVAPASPPTHNGSVASYKASNLGYKSSLSKWCAECHNQLLPNAAGTAPAHFLRHPVNVAINVAGGHTDPANWVSATPVGVQTGEGATGDNTFGIPRVPFQVSTATNLIEARTVAASNEVFCGSCHLAHGWKYGGALLWPYKEGGADAYAGCIQCHNE